MAKQIKNINLNLSFDKSGNKLRGLLSYRINSDVDTEQGSGQRIRFTPSDLTGIGNKKLSEIFTLLRNKIKQIENIS